MHTYTNCMKFCDRITSHGSSQNQSLWEPMGLYCIY